MIAFDIDSVIIDFGFMLERELNRRGYDWQNKSNYDVETVLPIPRDQLLKVFEQIYLDTENAIYVPEARGVLMAIHHRTGVPIQFITSRPIKYASDTHIAIRRLLDDIPFQIAFADNVSKHTFMNGIDQIVEDRRKTAMELAAMGKFVFLFDQPWNQLMWPDRKIVRIHKLSDLFQYIEYIEKAA